MFIYLNLPRPFWQIPDTDIGLSRSKPMRELTSKDLDALSGEQMDILKKSLELGIITKVHEDFIPKNKTSPDQEKILELPASEIQRKYVSKMVAFNTNEKPDVVAKIASTRISELERLMELEGRRDNPRQTLIELFLNAISQIKKLVPDAKLFTIEEDVIEDVVIQKPKTEPKMIKGKSRGRQKQEI